MWISFIILFFLAANDVSAIQEAWDKDSNPDIMSPYYNRKFSELPLTGNTQKSSTKLWSGGYWAMAKGNINYRWYAKNKIGFNHNSPSMVTARSMTIPQLAELSPSEKYDLFIGRYDYPLRSEVNKIASPSAAIWEGICHGWSPATMNHNEPVAKLMRNPDGIDIPFGSTDIKALLSYYYAFGFRATDTHQVGNRCYQPGMSYERDCGEDLNAGAFHLVLTNRLGIDGKSFIADFERFKEVWNHPVTAYRSQVIGEAYPGRGSAPGTVTMVRVRTLISFLTDNGNDWHPVIGTKKQKYDNVTYEYWLELDSQGVILGGSWISKLRPDFLWMTGRPRQFQGTLSRLEELLNDDVQ